MRATSALLVASVALISVFTLAPFLWFVLTSWKSASQIEAIPPEIIPEFHWGFYRSALEQHDLGRYLTNSIVIASATTTISITIAAAAAYAITRFPSRWSRWYLMLLLMISMFPQVAIAGPVWRILHYLNWLNTYHGIVAAYISLSLPFAIWVLATFFKEMPYEVEEAALIDGCSRLQALWKVVLPIAAPGLFTGAILVFIQVWNEFFFALIILTNPARQTLPVGIALFPGEYTMPWGEIAAASTMATLPLVLLTLIFQRRIIRGLSAGAVKG
ncbi:MAG TPA: carbohydrate ABC transporter permease [Candidatus Eisenbacteria bacterium]|nr:carbohydrate ABC transporter permease [Candidatus Eisenbacteria bacterium]